MERLTTKIDDMYTCSYCENIEAVSKLGKFEDFMEEVGVESLDEIETCIVDLNKENQTLKGNWAKLGEYAEQLKGTSLHMTAHHEVQKDDKKFGEFVGRFENAKEVLIKMQELESADGEL